MKQVYTNLTHANGSTNAGICTIQIAPKEWLANPIIVDFNTGKVRAAATLIAGKNWISIEYIPLLNDYEVKPKENKSGPYYEVSFIGTLNNMDPVLEQSILSLRQHECVLIFKQRNNLKKIIGDTVTGMLLRYSNRIVNANAGAETPVIELYIQTENPPLYYDI